MSHMHPTRRQVLLGLAAAAAAGLPAIPALAQGKEVRMGFQKGAVSLTVLKAQGDFQQRLEDLGYTVTWTEFPAGPPMLEAMNAGAIDLGFVGSPPPIFAQAAGADLVYVLASVHDGPTQGIIVPPDSEIQTLADLKGKKVANTKGSSANALLVRALKFGGLEWEDVEPVYLLPADAKAAFEGGSVDAWSIWDPYYAAAEAATGARTIATDVSIEFPTRAYYLASRPFATGNPEALEVLHSSLTESETWSQEHIPEVAKLIADETGLPEETIVTVLERRNVGVEPITPDIVAEQQLTADLFFDIGLIPEKVDILSATLLPQS
ncbi:MAG: aliphatic sulfonate ABC transporter substrate-binding protein [Thermomicrobiales bacterium]|nr:aliphatic sulfonate ABC transporter substrate-binding protein [Thermomicrobiales bacterium]